MNELLKRSSVSDALPRRPAACRRAPRSSRSASSRTAPRRSSNAALRRARTRDGEMSSADDDAHANHFGPIRSIRSRDSDVRDALCEAFCAKIFCTSLIDAFRAVSSRRDFAMCSRATRARIAAIAQITRRVKNPYFIDVSRDVVKNARTRASTSSRLICRALMRSRVARKMWCRSRREHARSCENALIFLLL